MMTKANIARRTTLIGIVAFSFAVQSASTSSAGTPAAYLPWKYFSSNCFGTSLKPGCGCPDDYCPKAQPTVCNECRGSCNNYCPKPMPQPCPTACGSCDNFCPKPWRPMSWCPPCIYHCWPGGCPSR